jgi:hypothetical protein
MGRRTKLRANCNSTIVRFNSIADMIFQNFDIALYIKEFIPSKYALPYYLVCKSTMSTARNKDNEFDSIETYKYGFCSTSLLRWAIHMDMPVTRSLFTEVCGHGVLNDVILLHKEYKCTWGHSAYKKAICNGHLHIVEYLFAENPDNWMCIFRYAIQNGKLEILEWIWCRYIKQINKYKPTIYGFYDTPFESACRDAAKHNHMNVLTWIESANIEMNWDKVCEGAAESGNVELLNWLHANSNVDEFHLDHIAIKAAQNGHLNIFEWIRENYDNYEWHENISPMAAKKGHLHILQWLHSEDPSYPWISATFNCGVYYKQKAITDWLQTVAPLCPVNKSTLFAAARNGDLKLVQWLRSLDPPCPFAHDTCYETLTQKHLHVLQWLVANGAPCAWDWTYCEVALINNDFQSLKWLRSLNPPCPWKSDHVCTAAIKYGNLEMLQWLISQQCEIETVGFKIAIRYNQLNILVWLQAQFPLEFNEVKNLLMCVAAYHGHVHILQWFLSLDPPCKFGNITVLGAVEGRKLHVVKWLRSQAPPCPWNERQLYKLAASRGDIMLMKCLRSLSKSRPVGDSVCAQAAENGHLKMIKWLRCQDPPYPINLNKCIALAAKNRHMEVVDWLIIQSGCANCSRNECRCKNRQIKIPQDFIEYESQVVRSQCDNSGEEYSDKSEDSDYSSDSEEEIGFNENYFDMLAQFHEGSDNDDDDDVYGENNSDLEDEWGGYLWDDDHSDGSNDSDISDDSDDDNIDSDSSDASRSEGE